MRGHIENVTEYSGVPYADGLHRASGLKAVLQCTGSPKVPIILVQFDDKKFTVAERDEQIKALYHDYFNAGEGIPVGMANSTSYRSVREYFRQQSDAAFMPEFQIIGPVTLSKSYKYYGEDSASGAHDIHFSEFVSESCQLAMKEGAQWSDFDNDGNGTVDFVGFIYAGEGQNATEDDPYTIWPKESTNAMTVTYGDERVTFSSYGCSNELFLGTQDGVGSIIHELAHALGLPDFYDTKNVAFGLGYWDIMDSGNYQMYGRQPCCMSAYERDFMGWRQLIELDPDSAYSLTLNPLELDGVGYKIANREYPDEYFILENRQNIGFDTYFGWARSSLYTTYGANHGLMITHVDYSSSAWASNRVNTDANHQRITIVPADGELVSFYTNDASLWAPSLAGDLYPGKANVTEMSSYAVFNGSTGTLGVTIDNIVEHEDGTITVDINGGKSNPKDDGDDDKKDDDDPSGGEGDEGDDALAEPDIPEIA